MRRRYDPFRHGDWERLGRDVGRAVEEAARGFRRAVEENRPPQTPPPGAGRRPRNACRAVCVRSAFGDAPRPPRQSVRPGLYGPRPVRRGAASGARWDDALPLFDRLPFRGRLRGDLQLFGHPDGPVCGFLCVGAHAVAQRAAVFALLRGLGRGGFYAGQRPCRRFWGVPAARGAQPCVYDPPPLVSAGPSQRGEGLLLYQ